MAYAWLVNLQYAASANGGWLEWYTHILHPGREPGMTGIGIDAYAVHIVRAEVAYALECAISVCDIPGCTVWGPHCWREAVAIYPRRGAIPAILAELTIACAH
eukprot:1174799-Lingulodinium_polyedra.AAC.1